MAYYTRSNYSTTETLTGGAGGNLNLDFNNIINIFNGTEGYDVTLKGVASGSFVINEGGFDYDVRMETNNVSSAFLLDASADTIALFNTTFSASGITMSGLGDLTLYNASNDGNPEIRLGATDAEEFHIQTVYDSGAQTLDYVLFATDAASATANKGKYIFQVDGTEIFQIVDGGISLSANMNLLGSSTSDITINTNKFTVAGASGNTSIAGTLGLTSDFAINTNKFNVTASSGNTTIAGTLGVTGVGTFTAQSVHNGGLTDGTATLNGSGAWTGITSLTVDNLNINLNTISSTSGGINITPVSGSAVVLDGHFSFDGMTMTALKNGNTTYTAYAGRNITIESVTFDGGVVAGVTSLTVDNLNIDLNTISATTGAINITPAAGSAIVLDGTISVDAGVVTGATSITSTAFTGTLSTAAQPNITSLGTLTALTVDNITLNGTDITSSAAELTINDAGIDLDVRVETLGSANTLFIQGSSGNVGIGTNSPDTLLQLSSTDPILNLYVSNGTADKRTFEMRAIGAAGFEGISFRKVNDARTVFSEIMFLDENGNVGIGTSIPTEPLHIHAASGSAQIRLTDAVTGQTTADGLLLSIDVSQNTYFYSYEATNMYFGNNNAIFMIANSAGDVGFGGVSTPAGQVEILASSGAQLVLSQSEGVDECGFTVDANGDLTIDPSGNNVILSCSTASHNFATSTYVFTTNTNAGSITVQPGSAGTVSFNLNNSGGTTEGSISYNPSTLKVDIDCNSNPGLQINTSGNLLFPNLASASTGTDLIIDGSNFIRPKSSSRRYKKDFSKYVYNRNKLYDLEPVNFTWKSTGIKDFGLIAEDTEKVAPELVNYIGDQVESVKYDQITLLLLEEIKLLNTRIQELENA